MGTHAITVEHRFEAAHRLPQLSGKCQSIHGHSWNAMVSVQCDRLTADDTIVEFGQFKAVLRDWLDTQFDHGTILGVADPLAATLREHGCRVFVFGAEAAQGSAEYHARDVQWPTVESVALVVHRVAVRALCGLRGSGSAKVTRVEIRETATNRAVFEA
jgi:6-pyruvoyltetrahydropterin/6-carboxytetrahydropterin synthase